MITSWNARRSSRVLLLLGVWIWGFLPKMAQAVPSIEIRQPAKGEQTGPNPGLFLIYSDPDAAIVTETLQVFVDVAEVTTQCTVTPLFASCALSGLTDGQHEIRASISSDDGSTAEAIRFFDVISPPAPPGELIFADGFESGDLFRWAAAATDTPDSTPPVITLTAPEPVVFNYAPAELTFEYADIGGKIVPESFRAFLDGEDVSVRCAVGSVEAICGLGSELDLGLHQIHALIWDDSDNAGQGSWEFEFVLDQVPPSVAILDPPPGFLTRDSQMLVQGMVTDSDAVASVLVNGVEAVVSGSAFQAEIELEPGDNFILALATDRLGMAEHTTVVGILDTEPPVIEVIAPRADEVVNTPTVRIVGLVEDDRELASFEVAGVPVPVNDGFFDTQVDLVSGPQEVILQASDRAGNEAEVALPLRRVDAPTVTIDTPREGDLLQVSSVDVTGTVSDPVASVTVSGIVAAITGTSFTAPNVPVGPGATRLSAVATDPAGGQAVATVRVFRDDTSPRVRVDYPQNGAELYEETISVSGLVNDVGPGTTNAEDVTVLVNGQEAVVVNRSFLLPNLSLAIGTNTLTVQAVDTNGNQTSTMIGVERLPQPTRRLIRVSGDLQQAEIGTDLALPFVVRLEDSDGNPVIGEQVVFSAVRTNGVLGSGERTRALVTGPDGQAATTFRLGTRVGVGNQRVEVSARGVPGHLTFLASALPGPPSNLIMDRGSQQTGAVNQALPEPLVAVVTDSGFNRLPGISVRLRAVQGGGAFGSGEAELIGITDANGRVAANLTLGPAEGVANNLVEVDLPDFPQVPVAGFVASGKAAGDPADTSISGLVVDNSDQPVPGVTVSLPGTALSVQTDTEGIFRLHPVPVGTYHLEVDGNTASRPGDWPHLEFELTTVPGQDNTLGMPIYLLPLDTARGLAVSASVGGVLTLPELPGFSLEVAPGSVTFPDGGQNGVVSATLVHGDKVPMVPSFGLQPRFILTIQPAGAVFDPPAKFTLPNVEELQPGESTELYSFDHDLGQFVSIGPGTVSVDGTVLESDPGVGIVKAGWHCGGNPAAVGTPHNCKPCFICNGIGCSPGCPTDLTEPFEFEGQGLNLGSCPCDDNDSCTSEDICRFTNPIFPECKGSAIGISDLRIEGNGEDVMLEIERDESGVATVSFSTEILPANHDCPNVEVRWKFGDGGEEIGETVSHDYLADGYFLVEAELRCLECSDVKIRRGMIVNVYQVQMRLTQDSPTEISDDGLYTEDTVLRVTAVRSGTGTPIHDFQGTVEIDEQSDDRIYHRNAGEFPSSVEISFSGTATFEVKSQIEFIDGEKPPEGVFVVLNYEMFRAEPLYVEQWVDNEQVDPRSRGAFPDWFEARMLDIFEEYGKSRPTSDVLATITGYRQEAFEGESNAIAGVDPDHSGQLEMQIDLFNSVFIRVPGEMLPSACAPSLNEALVVTVLHESRHGYQDLLSILNLESPDDLPESPNNDDDQDWLVDTVPAEVCPCDVLLDTMDVRETCNQAANETIDWMYQGDAVFDETFNFLALEMDAIKFATQQAP
ncbi:MAG: carboxypeptidase regulatory-like domain-containing protein [Deltaproteobacteria bacterium]|nr:carboxypeptidase regulatory-like domain-containing protein [Deltaproteobacteria bacterium]